MAITILTSIGTSVVGEGNNITYSNCKSDYSKITDFYVLSNYNVRTRKFLNYYEITGYSENFTTFKKNNYITYRLDRNTGNWLYGKDILKTCIKIELKDLPKLNTGDKLF